MARIFVTGSTAGLGLMAGRRLLSEGHDVIFHARNHSRADALKSTIDSNAEIVVGDISTVAGALDIADQVSALGSPDAVIHNAGLGADTKLSLTTDGVPDLFGVNVLAPYILTAKIDGPGRLIYMSSDMHFVLPDPHDMLWQRRSWSGNKAYSESKFYVTALAFAVARLHPEWRSNAVDPGWVPTRMGGHHAPDDLAQGALTQTALATGDVRNLAELTGAFLYHMSERPAHSETRNIEIQERLLEQCRKLSGISL